MKKIISLILVFAILMSLVVFADKKINSSPAPEKELLLVIDNEELMDTAMLNSHEIEYDLIVVDDFIKVDFNNYQEIAFPFSSLKPNYEKLLTEAYENDKKVYIYGELTISDYKKTLDIEQFGKNIDLMNEKGLISDKQVYLHFDSNYEDTEIHNVIALSKNESLSGLLASVPDSKNLKIIFKSIFDDVSPIITFQTFGLITRDEDFGIKTYTSKGSYIELDWILGQDTSETSPSYDYFYVKTITQAHGFYALDKAQSIYVNHLQYHSDDEMIDAKPTSNNSSGGTVGVSLSLDAVTLSYTFDMSSSPTISLDRDNTQDYAKWTVNGANLNGEIFEPSSSWATPTSKSSAGKNIYFGGYFYESLVGGATAPQKSVYVRFDY